MKKHITGSLLVLLLGLLLAPQVALASWWNPFSWGVFNKKESNTEIFETRIKEPEIRLSTSTDVVVSTSTTSSTSSLVVKQSKKELQKKDTSKEVRLKAELIQKAKVEQEALIAKQKADEQKRIEAMKAEEDRISRENELRERQNLERVIRETKEAQNKIDLQERQKQEKLNSINLKIANLNAKYAKDSSDAKLNTSGGFGGSINGKLNQLYSTYEDNYNALMAEYQLVKYDN
jgi:hypothetical protein